MQAVIKTMLNSPTADQGGYCNLFSISELRQLSQRDAKLLPKQKEVHDAIITLENHFKAYGTFSAVQFTKLISVFEVRCIMFAFNKKVASRASYESIKDIMLSVIQEARLVDSKLPNLQMLAESDASKRRKIDSTALRQVGKVSDGELEVKGFTVGAIIESCILGGNTQYQIVSLNADGTTINVKPASAEPEANAKAQAKAKGKAKKTHTSDEITLQRTDLHAYKLVVDDKPIFITNLRPLVDNACIIKSIIEGTVKQACLKELCNSSEDDCVIASSGTNPRGRVYASKRFGVGKLTLVPVTTLVCISEKPMAWTKLGDIQIGGKVHGVYLKGAHNALVKPGSKEEKAGKINDIASKFFIASGSSTVDARVANAEYSSFTLVVNVAKSKFELTIPKIVNTSVIKDEEPIIVLASSRS